MPDYAYTDEREVHEIRVELYTVEPSGVPGLFCTSWCDRNWS